jgi:hypothetical protein
MATLAEISKALDALDPKQLTADGVAAWATEQLSKLSPEHRDAHLMHINAQVKDAEAAFSKGATGFRVKEFAPPAAAKPTTPLADASAKLAKSLEDDTTKAKGDGEAEVDEDADETDDTEDESETDDATTAAAKSKPTRKAAPESIGKGYFEIDDEANANDVFGSPLGASMNKIKLGPDGKVYSTR